MEMSLSHNLMDQIERAPLDIHGQRCAIRFISVRPSPAPPLEPTAADITAETTFNGRRHRVTVHFGLERLSNEHDEAYVVNAIVGALRSVVTGDLPPGTIDYL